MMRHYWQDIPGWFAFRGAFDTILAAMPADRPSIIVELGTWLGRSTAYLGVEVINSGKPVTIVAVDHFQGSAEIQGRYAPLVVDSESAFRRNLQPVADALGSRFRLLVSDSATAAASFTSHAVDAVWIDAAHGYDFVRADIAAWWPTVRPGGFMGGDDFLKCPGVRQAVTEQFTDRAAINRTPYWLVRRAPDGSAVPMARAA